MCSGSPADWAWTGGLMDALLPTFYFGFPIVAYRGRFAPTWAPNYRALRRHNAFLFPTALKMMMRSEHCATQTNCAARALARDHERG